MRFRYEVRRKDLVWKSVPDRPLRTFPVKALADFYAALYNGASEKAGASHTEHYFVHDTKA